MDVKPFISSNKLTKPSFGHSEHVQNDNIVILAAVLEDDGSIEIPAEAEPFVEKWGAVVKSYVVEEFYHSVPKKYKSNYLCLFEIAEHMSPLYSLWVFMWGIATNKGLHKTPVPQELCDEWAQKYSDIRLKDGQEYSINIGEYIREIFPKLWVISLTASTIQPDELEPKEIDTVFATNFVSHFLESILPDVIFRVGITNGELSFEFLDLEKAIWYFVAELYYRTKVTSALLELPPEVFKQLSDMKLDFEDEGGAWHKWPITDSSELARGTYSVVEFP